MNKQEVYDFLKEKGIPYEVTEHQAVYNMEELDAVELPYPDRDAKNLFVRDDKKSHYYLITVRGDRRVNLKDFRKKQNLRNLSFASPEDLKEWMDLEPGAVTPLGILNDEKKEIGFYLDSAFGDGLIGVHPNDNTATVWLKAPDLIGLLKEHGNSVTIVDF
jgi:Ala-tRNA(Pro) deacylase